MELERQRFYAFYVAKVGIYCAVHNEAFC